MRKIDPRFSIIHPHIFRHEWNLEFSRKVDKNNNKLNNEISHKDFISPEKEAKCVNILWGMHLKSQVIFIISVILEKKRIKYH